MKKLKLLLGLMFCVAVQFASAQQTAKTTNTTTTKPISPDPGKASTNPKPAPERTEPRRVHLASKMPDNIDGVQPGKSK